MRLDEFTTYKSPHCTACYLTVKQLESVVHSIYTHFNYICVLQPVSLEQLAAAAARH